MSTFMILFLSFLAALIQAIPLTLRDVYDPPITNPNPQSVWHPGETQMVTWDTSGLPADLPNMGMVVLGFLANDSENLMLDNPLATNFKLTVGQVQITVPDVPTRNDYIIVLFGDSGNASPEFSIQSSSPPTTISSSTTTSSNLNPSLPSDVSSTSTSPSDPTNTPAPTSTAPPLAALPTSSSTVTSFTQAAATPSKQTSSGKAIKLQDWCALRPFAVGVISLVFWHIF